MPGASPANLTTPCSVQPEARLTSACASAQNTVSGTPVDELLVVGGGARIRLMNELYGRHAGVPVTVGSPEATALGNAVVQGLALGQFDRLEDARRWLAIGAERLLL